MRCDRFNTARFALVCILPVPKARGIPRFDRDSDRADSGISWLSRTHRSSGRWSSIEKRHSRILPFCKGVPADWFHQSRCQQSSTESEFVDGIVDAVCHPGSELGIRCNAALREHHGITSGTVRTGYRKATAAGWTCDPPALPRTWACRVAGSPDRCPGHQVSDSVSTTRRNRKQTRGIVLSKATRLVATLSDDCRRKVQALMG